MKVYQTNAALGYNQLAYIIELNCSENGHDYLVIGGHNIGHLDTYGIGTIVEDLEDFYLNDTTYKIEDSPLYGSFLFDFFLKNIEI